MAVAGHFARRNGHRWTKMELNWIPREMKRARQGAKLRWEDGMRECVGEMRRREAATAGTGRSLGRLHPAVVRPGVKVMMLIIYRED
ncbi:hypothetical protein FKM82_028197 [Ascaphus truei]